MASKSERPTPKRLSAIHGQHKECTEAGCAVCDLMAENDVVRQQRDLLVLLERAVRSASDFSVAQEANGHLQSGVVSLRGYVKDALDTLDALRTGDVNTVSNVLALNYDELYNQNGRERGWIPRDCFWMKD